LTITVATTAAELLERAGVAAARTLPFAEPVTPVAGPAATDLAGAVVVPFSGAVTGELALIADAHLIATLPPGAVESQGLAIALGPSIDAIMSAVGTVHPGIAQVLDARVAASRVGAHADSASINLTGAAGVRAVIAIGVDPAAAEVPAQRAPFASDRLDLLRGVEMQASAELGRARMTINDLLSLRTGAVIELDRAAGDPADLFVNGRLIARGEVVVVDENYALRITQIVSEENGR
jgi:flagellar motor switch protein FliN